MTSEDDGGKWPEKDKEAPRGAYGLWGSGHAQAEAREGAAATGNGKMPWANAKAKKQAMLCGAWEML